MYNKTITEFGFRMISWIIKTSCLYYLPQPSASADNTDLGFDNSRYHAQPHPIIVYYHHEWGFSSTLPENPGKEVALRNRLQTACRPGSSHSNRINLERLRRLIFIIALWKKRISITGDGVYRRNIFKDALPSVFSLQNKYLIYYYWYCLDMSAWICKKVPTEISSVF